MSMEALIEYIEKRDRNLIPECEIAVFQDHQCLCRRFWTAGGEAGVDRERNLYFLFSATKVITCTAAMRLVEEGKLGLDDPVYKYLPEFEELYVKTDAGLQKAKKVLTVRHLFSMSGGFTYNLGFDGILKVVEQTNRQATTRQIAGALSKMPLIFEPGENYQYSLCHDILAAVVEVASGMQFSEYLSQVIFTPLGMKDTTFRQTDEVHARLMPQYTVSPWLNVASEIEPQCAYALSDRHESGGAGLISSADDYARFADAMASGSSADGYRLLKPETVALMRTPQLCERAHATFALNPNFKGYSYACGVRTLVDREAAHAKSPLGEFGWDGAAGAYVLIDPAHRLSIFYAQHVLGCGYAYSTLHPTIRNLTYDAIKE